ncbi:MAG TPA: CRISPR system precrRNA processing endoribonuclease RAMP protein Cas6 [Bryobacteraceae bacterium]|nr:CRISPR system precrRNA processing endoribonuclease RAMP protein Cas6 [Bryobacteraceae bacterium]
MTFEFHRLRFVMQALEPLFLPDGKAGNVLRGSLGLMFSPEEYQRLFAPRLKSGPSGLADVPRPFVFRAAHLDGMRAKPGDRFTFEVNLFEAGGESAGLFAAAFERLGTHGLGPGRGKAALVNFEKRPSVLDLARHAAEVNQLTVRFLTPTELKGASRPEFGVLMARIRDRISTLRACYGPGPLELDFRAFGERASMVAMTACDLQEIEEERRSTRTGQRHSIGGFVGSANYEGNLGEFVPFLECAMHTGVGRQTVWGKGQIAVG